MNTRTFLYSALLAGAVIGVLANLPILNLINCFLCIWVWLGGFLAVFLYQRMEHGATGLTPAQGAGLGALAGLIGACVGIVVYALTSFISMPIFASFARFMQVEGDLPFDRVDPAGDRRIDVLLFRVGRPALSVVRRNQRLYHGKSHEEAAAHLNPALPAPPRHQRPPAGAVAPGSGRSGGTSPGTVTTRSSCLTSTCPTLPPGAR